MHALIYAILASPPFPFRNHSPVTRLSSPLSTLFTHIFILCVAAALPYPFCLDGMMRKPSHASRLINKLVPIRSPLLLTFSAY